MGKGDVNSGTIKIRRADLPEVRYEPRGPYALVSPLGDATATRIVAERRHTPAHLREKARAYLALAEHVEVRDKDAQAKAIERIARGLQEAGVDPYAATIMAVRLHNEGWKAP